MPRLTLARAVAWTPPIDARAPPPPSFPPADYVTGHARIQCSLKGEIVSRVHFKISFTRIANDFFNCIIRRILRVGKKKEKFSFCFNLY